MAYDKVFKVDEQNDAVRQKPDGQLNLSHETKLKITIKLETDDGVKSRRQSRNRVSIE